MNAKFFLLLFISLILGAPSYAQEQFDDIIEDIIPKANLSNEQLKHLREELKVQKMFIQGVKEIEIRGGQFTNIEKSTNTIHDLLKNSIGAKSTSLGKEVVNQVEEVVKGAINKNGIKNTLIKMKEMAYGFSNNRKIMMTSVARRFGFDLGIVYLCSLQVDVTFPLVMIASGQPQFGVLLATPVSSIATGSFAAAKSAIKFRQVVKMLGGVGKTINHYKIFSEVKKFFNENIFLKHDLLDFNFNEKTFVISVERQTAMSKILGKFGINKQLNFQSLVALLEENNLMADTVEQLKRSSRPDEVKFLRLINKIQLTGDPKVLSTMQSKFGKFINEVTDLPDFSKQRNWAVKLAHSNSFEQFTTILAKMPDDIPPKVFDRMWRNYILPTASKTIGPFMDKDTLIAFRKLFEDYDKQFRGQFMTSLDTSIGPEIKNRFIDYLYDSLAGVGACGNLYRKKTINTDYLLKI